MNETLKRKRLDFRFVHIAERAELTELDPEVLTRYNELRGYYLNESFGVGRTGSKKVNDYLESLMDDFEMISRGYLK